MIYLTKSKLAAIALYFVVNVVVYIRGIEGQLEASLWILGVTIIPILAPSIVAWFASWGFMESLAKDSKQGLAPYLVSFFYWLLLIIVSLFFLMNWSLH